MQKAISVIVIGVIEVCTFENSARTDVFVFPNYSSPKTFRPNAG